MNNVDGIAQLECYVDAYNNDKQNSVTYGADQAVVGNSYDSSFNGVAIPSVLHPGEYIVYRTYGDGLIIYNYQKKVPNDCKEYSISNEQVFETTGQRIGELDAFTSGRLAARCYMDTMADTLKFKRPLYANTLGSSLSSTSLCSEDYVENCEMDTAVWTALAVAAVADDYFGAVGNDTLIPYYFSQIASSIGLK